MSDAPTHRNEQTGNPSLDRIQANVRDLVTFVKALVESVRALTNRAYVALAVDTTIGVAAYATLLSATITTTLVTGYLIVSFSTSGVELSTAGTVVFQIVVDGKVIKGAYSTVGAGSAFSVSMVVRVPVKKGAHTVLLQWRSSVANARINAKSVNEEHAHLLVQEAA